MEKRKPIKIKLISATTHSELFSGENGTAMFLNEFKRLLFKCPGCGEVASIPISMEGSGKDWKWDGNKESPTLNPSIHSVGCCGWHGWLRGGIFSE